jgi:hypothetical protein
MWDDYIHFIHPDHRKTTYVRRLISFFPTEGYVIFEGYTRVLKSELPYKTDIYRVKPSSDFKAHFKAEITEIYVKDITEAPSKRREKDCDDCDDCEGCISFFPLDIVILKFNVLEKDNKFPSISWNFSVDNRFTSPTLLIERYLSLVEVPQDSNEPYDTCRQDDAFYDEYHTLMDKYEDVYLHEYSNFIKTFNIE